MLRQKVKVDFPHKFMMIGVWNMLIFSLEIDHPYANNVFKVTQDFYFFLPPKRVDCFATKKSQIEIVHAHFHQKFFS